MRLFRFLIRLFAVGIAAAATAAPLPVGSAEPVRRFLDALLDRGYYDLALHYVDRLEQSDRTPAEVQSGLSYQRGQILVRAARQERDAALRIEYLERAERSLQDFVQGHPQHESLTAARNQLASLLVERARRLVEQANQDESGRQLLLDEARERFAAAIGHLQANQQDLAARLKELPDGGGRRRDAALQETRNRMRSEYVQAKLAAARILFEQAATLKEDPEPYRQALTDAAAAFDEVAKKYRGWMAGLYATLYQGQCYQLLGDRAKALSYFQELIERQDPSPALRELKTRALCQAIDCWLDDPEGGPRQAIQRGTAWLRDARPAESANADWLNLKLQLARAHLKQAESLRDSRQADRQRTTARELASDVARRGNPHRQAAQELLANLGFQSPERPSGADKLVAFGPARDAGKQALQRAQVAATTSQLLESRLAKVTEDDNREQIRHKLEETRQQQEVEWRAATELFQRALELADASTSEEDINGVRYYLSYLYYTQQRYHRAAVLAAFVARRYPNGAAARECANIALAAYQQLYRSDSGPGRTSHLARISRLCDLILLKWPGQPQAENALITLVGLHLEQGELEQAQQLLERIPDDAPQRGDVELRVGQALWRAYLQGLRSRRETPESDAAGPDAAVLEARKRDAQAILADGVKRMRSGPPTDSLLRSLLSLAQIHVDSGQATAALDLLNDAEFGPQTLVDQGAAVADIPRFAEETCKTSIRAYVSSVSDAPDPQQAIDQASRVLQQLRDRVADSPQGRARLIGIYVSLAQDMERQMMIASPTARQALSQGFEEFLRQAGQASDDPTVLSWIGETLSGMGRSLDDRPEGEPGREAKRYYVQAVATFRKLLDQLGGSSDPEDEPLRRQVTVRLADTLRRLDRFQDAMDGFADVLRQQANLINIQVEAARTLQRWGERGSSDKFLEAIHGQRPHPQTGRNIIWGWGRIAYVVGQSDVLERFPQYRETLHEARYNIARCHYELALADRQQRRTMLEKAKRDILVTYRLYPELGTARQKAKYEALLRSVQKNLGEEPLGLAAAGNP
jgi:hypothetical protein